MTSPRLVAASRSTRTEAEVRASRAPANRQEWEDALVVSAAYFTCSVPQPGPRPRGQRMQWLVHNHPTLRAAVDAAKLCGPRALVYAVSATGDSTPLGANEWDRALRLRGEL